MRELNIAEDDPDEYEGRVVRWWGAEYIIGPFVAEGAERIIHQLINVHSSLSAHFIKVLKDQESAPEPTLRMIAGYKTAREWGLSVVQDPELVHAHGGWFEIDEAATLEADPHHALMAEVRLANDKGDLSTVAQKCQEILGLSPQHTDALQFSAIVLARQGDLTGAIELGRKIVTIEPNIRPYRFTLMEWVANTGAFELFGALLGELKEKWPGERRIDDLAAEVALARGRPEDAQELYLKDSTELKRRVTTEATALARAKTFLPRAIEALKAGRSDETLRYLASAYAEYSKNPVIAINYGLALLRLEDWQRSYDVLESVISAAPRPLRDGALAAMAVCSVHLGNHERAAQMLEYAASVVTAPDESISYWDLPAVPIWVDDDQELLSRDITMVSTINDIIQYLNRSASPIPSALLTLKDLYENNPEQQDTQN